MAMIDKIIKRPKFTHPADVMKLRLNNRVSIKLSGPINDHPLNNDIALNGLDISKEKATIYKNISHLKLIPNDAFVKQSSMVELSARMKEVGVTLNDLTKRGLKVPNRILQDVEMLSDSSKRLTVLNAYASLASIYAYVGFRVVGAVAVLGLPHTDIVSTTLNTIAAAGLLAGEGLVRIPTTIGFQHVILRALSRGPEYYKTEKIEKQKAAGMSFDPTQKIPFELYKDSPKCMTVLMISAEQNVLLRSLYGHFLVENKRQEMVVESNSTRQEKEFKGNVAEVTGWAKGILDDVTAARAKMNGQNTAEACDELVKVLTDIKTSYEEKSKYWMESARRKTRNREQGEAAALDEYLGMQLLMHAKKWQDKIDALNNKRSELSDQEMRAYLDSFCDYLEHRFTYNIILKFRPNSTIDMGLHDKMLGNITHKLSHFGIGRETKITAHILKDILKAIEEENKAMRRPLRKFMKKLRERVNGEGKPDKNIDAAIEKMLNDGITTEQAVAHILAEQLTRTPYRGGIKAGARSDVYDRLGKTFVKTKTLFGNEIEMKAEEWDGAVKETGYFKETSRVSWPQPDYIGSFDKDYVPLSIDQFTGEYVDVFRNNIPMFKKWSVEEGRVNVSLIQNLQINANYQLEGPLDEMGERMFIEHPLESVAKGSESDQQPWYGAFVLPIVLDNILNDYTKDGKSGKDFLEKATNKLFTQFYLNKDKARAQELYKTVLGEMGEERLNAKIDRTTGSEIIERMKRHAEDKLIATGIGPGRGYYGGMFSCGTCELEYVPGIILGYNRPYVQTIDGQVLAQADIRYNPATRRMEIFNYENRYSRTGRYSSEESFFMEKLNAHKLSDNELEYVKGQYPDKTVKIVDGRIHIIDADTDTLEKVIWWYDQNPTMDQIKASYLGWRFDEYPDRIEVNPKKKDDPQIFYLNPDASWENGMFKNCKKVEIDYSQYETERTVIRDHASDGSYYETKLGDGRIQEEVIHATQENLEEVVANLFATREIVGDIDVSVDPQKMDEVIVKINTVFPEIVTTFHSADGQYEEVVQTPPVYQPDKWITEDMATTYWHMFTGWQTEIQPVEAGRAVGPSDFTDMSNMHRRWFKGGPEVEKDFQVEMKDNGIKIAINGIPVPGLQGLTRSPVGWLINQAKKWPAHTVTDILLYGVPSAYWAGLYTLPKGLNPLSSPEMYIPVFITYLWLTLGVYIRPMGQLRNSHKDIWYKEALLRMLAPAYVDAWNLARKRQPFQWDATDAGDRKILPLEYLKGIAWRKNVSKGTAIFGAAYTTALAIAFGKDMPSPVPTLAGPVFNTVFPLINARLFDTGIKRFYGYWTSFDDLATYNCQLAGIEQKNVVVGGNKEKEIKITTDATDPTVKILSFTAADKKQSEKAINNVIGSSFMARSINATLGKVIKVLGKAHIGGWRPIKKDDNIIIHGHGAAQLVSEPTYEETEQGVKTVLKIGINPDAKRNFQYEDYDRRIWVNGKYYFSRDIKIQRDLLSMAKKKAKEKKDN
jgi:hypothetical protein